MLVKAGANINSKILDDWTLLHFVCSESKIETALWLIEHGADVNAKDRLGRTPLDVAEPNVREALVKSLNKTKDSNNLNKQILP